MTEPDRPQMTGKMRFASWVTDKYADTHLYYLIIIAFPWQQWLRERISMLCYTYITFLAFSSS